MQYGICNLTLVPMRAEPSHKTEMVNQMLFGEVYIVNETYEGWYNITLQHDGYSGWISPLAYTPLKSSDYYTIIKNNAIVSGNIFSKIIDTKSNYEQFIVAGSLLRLFDKKTFYAGNKRFKFKADEKPQIINNNKTKIKLYDAANFFVGSPYLWGGRSVFGIDCSGLVQIAARLSGVFLPRDASQQIHSGEIIDFISEAKAGDLAFFEDNEGNIVHTGIIDKNGDIIHAHGYVRIDGIDHNGIFNKETCVYSHKLRLIKRIK